MMSENSSIYGSVPPIFDTEPPLMSPTNENASNFSNTDSNPNDWCDFSGFVSSSNDKNDTFGVWHSNSPPPLSPTSETSTDIVNQSAIDYSKQLESSVKADQGEKHSNDDESSCGFFYKDDTSDKINNHTGFDDFASFENADEFGFDNVYFKNETVSSPDQLFAKTVNIDAPEKFGDFTDFTDFTGGNDVNAGEISSEFPLHSNGTITSDKMNEDKTHPHVTSENMAKVIDTVDQKQESQTDFGDFDSFEVAKSRGNLNEENFDKKKSCSTELPPLGETIFDAVGPNLREQQNYTENVNSKNTNEQVRSLFLNTDRDSLTENLPHDVNKLNDTVESKEVTRIVCSVEYEKTVNDFGDFSHTETSHDFSQNNGGSDKVFDNEISFETMNHEPLSSQIEKITKDDFNSTNEFESIKANEKTVTINEDNASMLSNNFVQTGANKSSASSDYLSNQQDISDIEYSQTSNKSGCSDAFNTLADSGVDASYSPTSNDFGDTSEFKKAPDEQRKEIDSENKENADSIVDFDSPSEDKSEPAKTEDFGDFRNFDDTPSNNETAEGSSDFSSPSENKSQPAITEDFRNFDDSSANAETTDGLGDFSSLSDNKSEPAKAEDFGDFGNFDVSSANNEAAGTFNDFSSPSDNKSEPNKTEELGDFENFDVSSANKETADTFNDFSSASDNKSEPNKTEELGNFENFDVSSENKETADTFNDYSSPSDNKATETNDFGDFRNFDDSSTNKETASTFGEFSSPSENKSEPTKTEDFGDFGNFDVSSANKEIADTFNDFSSLSDNKSEPNKTEELGDFEDFDISAANRETPDTFNDLSSPSDDKSELTKTEDFGDFGNFNDSSTNNETADTFGDFSSPSDNKSEATETNDFGDFGNFDDSSTNKETASTFGEFSSPSENKSEPTKTEDFGDFGNFDVSSANKEIADTFNDFSSLSNNKSEPAKTEDFGDFGNFDVSSANKETADTFNDFSSASEDKSELAKTEDFGDFGSFDKFSTNKETSGGFDDFSSLSDNKSEPAKTNDFGDFGSSNFNAVSSDVGKKDWCSFKQPEPPKSSLVYGRCKQTVMSSFGNGEDIINESEEEASISRTYDISEHLKNIYQPDTELTFWDELQLVKNDDDHWLLHFFTSNSFKNQILSFSFDYKEIKMKTSVGKHMGDTPTLSPSNSIGSFDIEFGMLVPEQVNPKNTLLAQSQNQKLSTTLLERIPSLSSSLKKDSESGPPSETTSLDLDFFLGGPIVANVTKEQNTETSMTDLGDLSAQFNMPIDPTVSTLDATSSQPVDSQFIMFEGASDLNDDVFTEKKLSQSPSNASLTAKNVDNKPTIDKISFGAMSREPPPFDVTTDTKDDHNEMKFSTYDDITKPLPNDGAFTNDDSIRLKEMPIPEGEFKNDKSDTFAPFGDTFVQSTSNLEHKADTDKYAVFMDLSTNRSAIFDSSESKTITQETACTKVDGELSFLPNETTENKEFEVVENDKTNFGDFGSFSVDQKTQFSDSATKQEFGDFGNFAMDESTISKRPEFSAISDVTSKQDFGVFDNFAIDESSNAKKPEFSAFTDVTAKKDFGDFGNFTIDESSITSKPDHSSFSDVTVQQELVDSGSFSVNQNTAFSDSTIKQDFGEFGDFAKDDSSITDETEHPAKQDFGDFPTNQNLQFSDSTSKQDGIFGNFAVKDSSISKIPEFSAFADVTAKQEFGDFGNFATDKKCDSESATFSSQPTQMEFGDFGSFSEEVLSKSNESSQIGVFDTLKLSEQTNIDTLAFNSFSKNDAVIDRTDFGVNASKTFDKPSDDNFNADFSNFASFSPSFGQVATATSSVDISAIDANKPVPGGKDTADFGDFEDFAPPKSDELKETTVSITNENKNKNFTSFTGKISEFGDFSSIAPPSISIATSHHTIDVNSETTPKNQGESTNAKQNDSFLAFSNFSSTQTAVTTTISTTTTSISSMENKNQFSDFTGFTQATVSNTQTSASEEFADFSSFSGDVPGHEASTGVFSQPVLTPSNITKTKSEEKYEVFKTLPESPSSAGANDFGAFSDTSSISSDMGHFTPVSNHRPISSGVFGDFSSASNVVKADASNSQTSNTDKYAVFASLSAENPTQTSSSFGEFSAAKSKDDFTDFSAPSVAVCSSLIQSTTTSIVHSSQNEFGSFTNTTIISSSAPTNVINYHDNPLSMEKSKDIPQITEFASFSGTGSTNSSTFSDFASFESSRSYQPTTTSFSEFGYFSGFQSTPPTSQQPPATYPQQAPQQAPQQQYYQNQPPQNFHHNYHQQHQQPHFPQHQNTNQHIRQQHPDFTQHRQQFGQTQNFGQRQFFGQHNQPYRQNIRQNQPNFGYATQQPHAFPQHQPNQMNVRSSANTQRFQKPGGFNRSVPQSNDPFASLNLMDNAKQLSISVANVPTQKPKKTLNSMSKR